MPVFAQPGQPDAKATYKSRYDNWIGGDWVPPKNGKYFENPSANVSPSRTWFIRSGGIRQRDDRSESYTTVGKPSFRSTRKA